MRAAFVLTTLRLACLWHGHCRTDTVRSILSEPVTLSCAIFEKGCAATDTDDFRSVLVRSLLRFAEGIWWSIVYAAGISSVAATATLHTARRELHNSTYSLEQKSSYDTQILLGDPNST